MNFKVNGVDRYFRLKFQSDSNRGNDGRGFMFSWECDNFKNNVGNNPLVFRDE